MKTKLSKTLIAITVTCFFCTTAFAQTTTVLNFTADDPAKWSDGIVEDGEGGSTDIAGVVLQIYNLQPDGITPLSSPMKWYENDNLSSSVGSYTAITEDFDTSAGSKGIAIKEKDNKLFSLNSFIWYDWGFTNGATVTVKGYVNGIETTSTTFVSNITAAGNINNPVNINFFSTPVDNVDEVRMTTVDSDRFPSLNNISITTNTTLPVSLVSFNTKLENNGEVLLNWRTSSEQNNKKFVLQHSLDGQSFKNLEEINSKGNADNTYSFVHINPGKGINYYQLLQEDINGEVKSIGLKSVNYTFNGEIVIYPNPTYDFAEINFQDALITDVKVLDAQGRMLNVAEVKLSKNKVVIDVRALSNGHYYVQLIGRNTKILRKLIKI